MPLISLGLLVLLVAPSRLHLLLLRRLPAPRPLPSPWPDRRPRGGCSGPEDPCLCMVGGIRDAILFQDFHLLLGFIAIFVAALVEQPDPGQSGQLLVYRSARGL